MLYSLLSAPYQPKEGINTFDGEKGVTFCRFQDH